MRVQVPPFALNPLVFRGIAERTTPNVFGLKRLTIALLVGVLACHARSVPAPRKAAASVAPSASPSFDAAVRIRRTPRDVVEAWNLAHVRHDARALEALYAPSVLFYGKRLSGHACVERKKAAFAKDPSYTQSIRDVHVDAASGAGAVVTFTKTSTTHGTSTDFPAILVVFDGAITAETDTISEANLAARPPDPWCVVDGLYPPNGRVIPPYRISASEADSRARLSAHFKAHEAALHGALLDFGQIWCPTECRRVPNDSYDSAACGYRMRLENHSKLQRCLEGASDECGSDVVEWVYVDAIDGTLYWQDGTKEELPQLPDL